MIIRKARPDDNERLLALERLAPQGDVIQLLSERKNYFVRASRFDDPILMVAEDEVSGNILGIMGVGVVPVIVSGKPVFGGLVFDWRANSQANQGLPRHMLRLWQAVLNEVKSRQIDFLFGYVKEDNARSLKIVTRSGARLIEERVFLTIPVHRPFFRDLQSQPVSVESTMDAHSESAILQRVFAGRDLLPQIGDAGHAQALADKYLKAKISSGASSLKIWDSTGDYTHRIMRTPKYYKVARPIFNAISHVLPLPHVPSPGEEIREWFLFDMMVDRPAELPVMLEKARRLALEHRIDYLIVCMNEQDHLYPAMARYAWLKLKYNLLFLPLTTLDTPSAPTYFDVRYL